MTVKELLPECDGSRFQKALADFIIEHKLLTVVESGFGVSSVFILDAMDKYNLDYRLFSIDKNAWFPHRFEHRNHKLIEQKSEVALIDLYQKIGPFDLFLHDSDHDIKCQTYEYEFGWQCLKPGGYLWSDDRTWGGHNAWAKFVKQHDLVETIVGDAAYVRKPIEFGFVPAAKAVECHELNLHLAQAAENRWLAEGNKNSDVFKD